MGAVYRISHDGWDYDKAYTEMKNYEFSPGLFHGKLKSFVKQYSEKTSTGRTAKTERAAALPMMTAAPAVAH
jgi:hypothetical protein